MVTILVTGGAGFIGSHTCVELLNEGYQVVVVDNLVNSKVASLQRVEQITGKSVKFMEVDINDEEALAGVFTKYRFDAVIHFAALKAVGESNDEPLRYYTNNVSGTLNLLNCMKRARCKQLVFSSSATVYGPSSKGEMLTENSSLAPTNPYGRSKYFMEQIMMDWAKADDEMKIALLRYFNPVGAHPSGLIGEDPFGIPNNLMPFVCQVAIGKRPYLNVFGDDYETRDGTGLRDYIHVVDLAKGHVAALKHCIFGDLEPGAHVYNLGGGKGTTVLELVAAMEKASGRKIPTKIVGRREGDVAAVVSDPSKAKEDLGWEVKLSIEDACRDAWLWQQNNPSGFASEDVPGQTVSSKAVLTEE